MTSLRERLLSTVAGQLGRPHGILSPFVARVLKRGNERAKPAAVDSAEIPRGAVAADIGFGFTIHPVGETAAALQNSGLQVEQHRIAEKAMPRYLFIGRRD